MINLDDTFELQRLDIDYGTELVTRQLRALPGDVTQSVDGAILDALEQSVTTLQKSAEVQERPEAISTLAGHLSVETQRIKETPGGVRIAKRLSGILETIAPELGAE